MDILVNGRVVNIQNLVVSEVNIKKARKDMLERLVKIYVQMSYSVMMTKM